MGTSNASDPRWQKFDLYGLRFDSTSEERVAPMSKKALVSWNGINIDGRGEMLSLTDMWRSEGSPENKRPGEWLRQDQAKQFIAFIANSLGMGEDHIIKTKKGRDASTYGHWQIAM